MIFRISRARPRVDAAQREREPLPLGADPPVDGDEGLIAPVDGVDGRIAPVDGVDGRIAPVDGVDGRTPPVEGVEGRAEAPLPLVGVQLPPWRCSQPLGVCRITLPLRSL